MTLVSVLSLGAGTPNSKAATVTQVSPTLYVIHLPANLSGWQSTGITVCSDSRWGLKVDGVATCCFGGSDPAIESMTWSGPGGMISRLPFSNNTFLAPNAPPYSLVGLIGSTAFYAGEGGLFSGSAGNASANPIADGALSFAFNDNFHDDNDGFYILYLSYVSGSCPPAAIDDQLIGPSGSTLGAPTPNPMNVGTRFHFENEAAGPYSISVLDVSGRRVRSIYSGSFEAGSHLVQWDGTDSHGRQVPSGTYYCVVDGGGAQLTQRVVVIP